MNTVIGAVNEFKGVYFDGECGDEDHQDEVVVALKDFSDYQLGDIKIGSGNAIGNSYWKVICTREEFNQCVNQMATNYGTSEAYSDYKANYAAINDDMNPVTSPTFTHVMHVRNELPQIGAECLFFDDTDFEFNFDWENGDKIVCVFHSTDEQGEPIGVYRHSSGVTVSLVLALVKPLTPPIELINGCAYQFVYVNNNKKYHGVYSEKQERFLFIDGHVMASYCKSIQLLGVAK